MLIAIPPHARRMRLLHQAAKTGLGLIGKNPALKVIKQENGA
jgi:hypothetical protein